MSLLNSNRILLLLPNVDVFVFGESSLFGYDPLNNCLTVIKLDELKTNTNPQIDRFHLWSSPRSPIRRLILNEDESILALISDHRVYLVYLPKLNQSSTNSRLCLLNEIPHYDENLCEITSSIIDFIWLSTYHLILVYSQPSACQCHLYVVQQTKSLGTKFLQTFSVGLLPKLKGRNSSTPNKRISLRQSSDIVKFDCTKRKQDQWIIILLFALKTDGDIFIMEMNQNQLIQK
jgi:hypothetical protein